MNGFNSLDTNIQAGTQPGPQAETAAQICMARIQLDADAAHPQHTSPLYAIADITNRLNSDPVAVKHISIVRDSSHPDLRLPPGAASEGQLVSAWPLKLNNWAGKSEKPLLYLTSTSTAAELCALSMESSNRGILCNDIETARSRWPKGAHPWLPLWLSANSQCQPFDPANGAEARAITLAALDNLYVQGESGFYYMALHDEPNDFIGPLNTVEAESALKGMYRVMTPTLEGDGTRVRLLGAGRAMQVTFEAARLLNEHWGISCELWSCPSYTRLAREADSVNRWNRLHPGHRKRTSHLQQCLGIRAALVVAVTGYPQSVVDQIREHVPGQFIALGANSIEPAPSSQTQDPITPQWITLLSLIALAKDGEIPDKHVQQARHRYGLP